MSTHLSVKKLNKKYSKTGALHDISFSVEAGEVYGIVGLWYSGKSMLLNMIAHHVRPDSGEIEIMGKKESEDYHTPIGAMIGSPSFIPNFSVMDNLLMQCSLFYVKNPKKHVKELMKRFALDKVAKKAAGKLSDDQKQVLGIAMAFVSIPGLILLDEPFEHLEPASLSLVKEIIQEVSKKEHVTILITSKMIKPIQDIADRFCVLSEGGILREIRTEDIQEISFSRICLEVDHPDFALKLLAPYHPMVIDQTFYINYWDDGQLLSINRLLYEHGILVTKSVVEQEDIEQSYQLLTGSDISALVDALPDHALPEYDQQIEEEPEPTEDEKKQSRLEALAQLVEDLSNSLNEEDEDFEEAPEPEEHEDPIDINSIGTPGLTLPTNIRIPKIMKKPDRKKISKKKKK